MILIVDDKQENLFSLKSLLQLHLYEVDTASSGEEALKKILRKEYALIILDVQMPEMDGYEVAEAVTGLNKTKDIPIIFLSAVNIDKRFITKGYDSGAVDYVTKPFDPDLLLLKVKTFCRLYEQKRELKSTQETLKKEIESRKLIQKEIERVNLSLEEKVQHRTKELVRVNQDLETRNAELGQYASLASHDLQEPLRKIVTFSRILDDKYLANMPDAHKYMSKVINSAERMRSLIDDLLNYSKLSVQLQFSKLDLNEILATTLADLEILIEEKGAEVTTSGLPKIEAVPGQMRQLFQNLISNALKFSKANSIPKVKIWSERVSEKSLNAVPSSKGEFVRIFIEDNGIGFDELYLDKIFTIFQRLHVRSDYEGTGIGLAIVKKIVEKHDGIIGAKSKEGLGATFFIILPIHQKNTQVTAA
ncbi:MAG TPA: response regulator [Flavitalea sp.]|nr:response regulator [Flavitalea sp.]